MDLVLFDFCKIVNVVVKSWLKVLLVRYSLFIYDDTVIFVVILQKRGAYDT